MTTKSEKMQSKLNRIVGRQDNLETAAEHILHRLAVLEVVLNYMIEKNPKLLEGFEEDQKRKADEAAAAQAKEKE